MRFIRHTAVVLVLVAALAACGNHGKAASTVQSTVTTTTVAAASTAPAPAPSTSTTTAATASNSGADTDLAGVDQLLSDIGGQLSSADSGMNQSES